MVPHWNCNVRISDGLYLPIMMPINSYDERLDRCLRNPTMEMEVIIRMENEKWIKTMTEGKYVRKLER